MSTVDIMVSSEDQDSLIEILSGLGFSPRTAGKVRTFGFDGEFVRILFELGSGPIGLAAGALWAWAKVRSAISVKVGDMECKGLPAESVIKILEARKNAQAPDEPDKE